MASEDPKADPPGLASATTAEPLPEQLFDLAVPDAEHTLGGVKDAEEVRCCVGASMRRTLACARSRDECALHSPHNSLRPP